MTDENTTEAPESQQTNETAAAPNLDASATQTEALSVGETIATEAAVASDDTVDAGAEIGELQKLRETLAGGDDKLLKQLERYKSTDAISKAFKEARQAAQQGRKPLRLADKANDEEVKAFREAVGIPAEPEAYPVAFRDDYKATEADTAILGEFKEAMHARNVDPVAAKAALDWYQDFATVQQQELDGTMARVAKETQNSLRNEWGGEYDGNLGAVRELMTSQLGEDGFNRMMGVRMMDGSRLQDDPGFVKMMAQIATDYYGSNAIFNGDIETTAKTVDERIAELMKMRTEDPDKYFSDDVQEKVTKLYAQRDKIQKSRK